MAKSADCVQPIVKSGTEARLCGALRDRTPRPSFASLWRRFLPLISSSRRPSDACFRGKAPIIQQNNRRRHHCARDVMKWYIDRDAAGIISPSGNSRPDEKTVHRRGCQLRRFP